ncbi:MAG: glycosyltransferase family 4 protein [Actinomycetota bacterium]|nr:glycosyltransferase family 4 protein [Actinomycetota bacterium]
MSRVLLVGRGPPERGGIAAYMLGILNGPLAAEHDIELVNLTPGGPPQAGRLTGANVRRTIYNAKEVFTRAKDRDIVHIHTALVPGVTLLRAALLVGAARLRRRKVVLHVHSGKVQLWLTGVAKRTIARLMLRPASVVVAVSHGALEALRPVVRKDRLTLIENGVDVNAFGPPDPRNDPPKILYVGLLTPRKGVVDLIRASDVLRARGVAHELVLVGGTPDEGTAEEREVREAARGKATVLGSRPHEAMPDIYREADVFCLPSWWEAMPLTLLEAMATGLPCVATEVGDIPRMIEDEEAGVVVSPRDPTALADAIERLLVDRGSAEAMGEAARNRAGELFSARGTERALEEIYQELGRV